MGKKLILSMALAVAAYLAFKCYDPLELPPVDLQQWWGPNETKGRQDKSVRPFRIEFNKSMVKDLLHRLDQQRPVPPPLEGVGFQYGFNSDYLQTVVHFWRTSYNFQKREEFLNSFLHFKTNIQGLDIHFIHAKPKLNSTTVVVPLLMLHGWPSSVREFYKIIPTLTMPKNGSDFVFEVIVPSLPGYGFSESSLRPHFGPFEMAIVMRNLMHRLGHKQYYLQGGDWGSVIAIAMATVFQDEVLGLHSNMIYSLKKLSIFKTIVGSLYPSLHVEKGCEDRMMSEKLMMYLEESGYYHLQATKPDTIGVALTDSPAGLVAYLLEKISIGTNHNNKNSKDGRLTENFELTDLLDNIMIYWTSRSITTSLRIYAEWTNKRQFGLRLDEISTSVPTWAMKTKYEIIYQPDSVIRDKFTNLLGSTILDKGGHYAAFELPDLFAEDIWKAVSKFIAFRRLHNKV